MGKLLLMLCMKLMIGKQKKNLNYTIPFQNFEILTMGFLFFLPYLCCNYSIKNQTFKPSLFYLERNNKIKSYYYKNVSN